MKTALPVVMTARLNLKPKDIAEIGGFSLRFAQALTAGKVAFPLDVVAALKQIDMDVDAMLKDMLFSFHNGETRLYIFQTNEDLRKHYPKWPGRGKASGPFVGPHRIATYHAWELIKQGNKEPDVLFHP